MRNNKKDVLHTRVGYVFFLNLAPVLLNLSKHIICDSGLDVMSQHKKCTRETNSRNASKCTIFLLKWIVWVLTM